VLLLLLLRCRKFQQNQPLIQTILILKLSFQNLHRLFLHLSLLFQRHHFQVLKLQVHLSLLQQELEDSLQLHLECPELFL
jgi:hypothetical protein